MESKKMENSPSSRVSWSSHFGFLMAAVGSAVGLGNLWRFPFIAANGGGGAFLILYMILAGTVGLTLVLLEMSLGAKMHLNPVGAMRKINPRFGFIGSIGVIAVTIIFGFYSVVGGWIIHYFVFFTTHSLNQNFEQHFSSFIQNPYIPLCYTALFIAASTLIVSKGIAKGIERYSKIMMPALFVLLLALVVRSLFLPRAFEGLQFFLYPDISKITPQTFLTALGQVFFSLSVGMGIFITYGSYMSGKQNVLKSSCAVVGLDLLVSLCAGLMIFPAVFAFNVPLNSGPTLLFITLPKIFASIPFGNVIALLFFMLLILAALTSSISMIEVAVTYVNDMYPVSRKKAVIWYGLLCFVWSIPMSFSFGVWENVTVFGKTLFDAADYLASNIMLPLGGVLMSLSVGWGYGMKNLDIVENAVGNCFFDVMIKYVAPILVFFVLLNATGLI